MAEVSRFFLGSEDQGASERIETDRGTDNTPAFRGTAIDVREDMVLTNYGNRIPNMSYEVVARPQSGADLEPALKFNYINTISALNQPGITWSWGTIGVSYHGGVLQVAQSLAGGSGPDAQSNSYYRTVSVCGYGIEETAIRHAEHQPFVDVIALYPTELHGVAYNNGSLTWHSRARTATSPITPDINFFSGRPSFDSTTGSLDYDRGSANHTGMDGRSLKPASNWVSQGGMYVIHQTTTSPLQYQLWPSQTVIVPSGSADFHLRTDRSTVWVIERGATHYLHRTDTGAVYQTTQFASTADGYDCYRGEWEGATGVFWVVGDTQAGGGGGGNDYSIALYFLPDTASTSDSTPMEAIHSESSIAGTLDSRMYGSDVMFLRPNLFLELSTKTLFSVGTSLAGVTSPETDATYLSDIVYDICIRAGMAAGEIDVSGLAGQAVWGFYIDEVRDMRQQLEPLQQVWPFEAVEDDYKLKFVLNGSGASVVTITEDDLRPRNAGDVGGELFEIVEVEETKLPRRLNLHYIDRCTYEPAVVFAERSASASSHIAEIEVNIAMSPDEAAQRVDSLLRTIWVERFEYKFSLPKKYSYLKPTDIITLETTDITVSELRLTVIDMGVNGILECRGVPQDANTYVSNTSLLGAAQKFNDYSIKPEAQQSALVVLDNVILQNDDGDATEVVMYIGAASPAGAFTGVAIEKSTDNGETWESVENSIITEQAVIATVPTAIGDPVSYQDKDYTNTLSVVLTSDGATLSNATLTEVLDGTNIAAYGAPGRWEIIGFETATDTDSPNAGINYDLTTLYRGLNGTEWAGALHEDGDRFVIIDSDALIKITHDDADIGTSVVYRAITSGSDALPDEYLYIYVPVDGDSYRDWAPSNVYTLLDGSGDTTISWHRRSKWNGEWQDGQDVGLSAQSTPENYVLKIYNDTASPATLVRTVGGSPLMTDEYYTYTAANKASDFGSPLATDALGEVYQVNQITGAGYSVYFRIPL